MTNLQLPTCFNELFHYVHLRLFCDSVTMYYPSTSHQQQDKNYKTTIIRTANQLSDTQVL